MLFNLLTDEASESFVPTLIISIVAILLIIGIMVVLCFVTKKLNTRSIVFAGITIALSFCLSYIKFSPVSNGGSITLASMLPVIIYAYFYGFGPGLLCGVCHGLLQFIQEPYILTPVTFIFDYVLAFGSIAVAPLFKKIPQKTVALACGIVAVYIVRFISHFISGIFYFPDNTLIEAMGLSAAYQATYIPLDCAISLAASIVLSLTGVIDILEKQALKGLNKKEKTETTEN